MGWSKDFTGSACTVPRTHGAPHVSLNPLLSWVQGRAEAATYLCRGQAQSPRGGEGGWGVGVGVACAFFPALLPEVALGPRHVSPILCLFNYILISRIRTAQDLSFSEVRGLGSSCIAWGFEHLIWGTSTGIRTHLQVQPGDVP